jgi:hypothetical protein
MNKIILLATILVFQSKIAICQERPKVYLSGIEGNFIKESRLLDTSIRIFTNTDKKIKGIIRIYFSGGGFLYPITIEKFIGSKLQISSWIGLKEKLTVGSTITIGGYSYFDKERKEKIYFEESAYKIIAD